MRQFRSATFIRLRAGRMVIGPLMLALLACASAQDETNGLVVVGVVGPQSVALTEAHPMVYKPIAVILENPGSQPQIIPDAASLQNLVGLKITPLGAATNSPPVLAPPRNFPLTIQPGRKLTVVFRASFNRADSSSDVSGFEYAATVNRSPAPLATLMNPASDAATVATAPAVASTNAAGASGSVSRGPIRRGADKGATVTASPMRVVLKKKGNSPSDPITFTAKWNQHPYLVSGWDESPRNGHADDDLSKARSTTARAQWDNSSGPGAGQYNVGVYLEHSEDGLNVEAHPTVLIDVITVELKDDKGNDADGLSIGVSTGTDRSRTLTATVTPAADTSSVMLKVSKGGGNLSIKNIQYGNGSITFQAEGIGTAGSKSQGDCTIEADVDGKPAATADVTVVIPKMLTQSKGTFYTQNVQANSGTTPAQPRTPGPALATIETFYGFPVTVTVMDQFGAPVADANNPHLYQDAPVFEAFIVKSTTYKPAPINLKISANSDYVDPVGFQVWPNSFFGASPPWGFYNPNFSAGTTPLFGIPNFPPHSKTNPAPQPTVFNVVVDGFTLQPSISRTLDIVGTTVSLTQTP